MKLQLAAPFSDHMVLQRSARFPVWGWAAPDRRITVALGDRSESTVADHLGRWMIRLGPFDAGGPFEMTVSTDAGESISFADVLIGDVFLCSGQSNMEFNLASADNGQAEVAAADFPHIRLFHVPYQTATAPQTHLRAAWVPCSSETVAGFSAVAYLFGREIHQTQRVPIGLINASWGGTTCEAWMSREALAADPALASLVQQFEIAQKDEPARNEEYLRLEQQWAKSECYSDPGNRGEAWGWASAELDTADWNQMRLPTPWGRAGLNMNGAVWFRREINLPTGWSGKKLKLSIGACDDFDETYFNGEKIGKTDATTLNSWHFQRAYTVPSSLAKPGVNSIAVRVFNRANEGGMIGPATMLSLVPFDDSDDLPAECPSFPLAGEWKYKIELILEHKSTIAPMPPRPVSVLNQNCPTLQFNGMISPLIPFAIRAVLWYQGESNADRAWQYRALFPALIRSWRDAWARPDLPFLFVELARWKPPQPQPGESDWAELREAQAYALKLPAVGRATIIDTGDAIDIHPPDKQTVAHRLALVAREMIYGEPITSSGPVYRNCTIEAEAIRLFFDHSAGGLVSSDGKALRGFSIAGADRRFVWADAIADGVDCVLVRAADVRHPVAVRYAWADNPDCNLASVAGVPASPFRTDDWPGITDVPV